MVVPAVERKPYCSPFSDDRYSAAAPVVSLASHFDGGCPCESGLPVTLACSGTNNAELAALFAPRPLLIVFGRERLDP